ncbi:MAG: hypothetical protein CYPHOPRED_003494 [Cyphobasidiales sp. Tagirdzhanova-0007]|nr:MAG: hypothetical protein CYPHOPRED_003494 [Cyphobasidiales sp. Tagirdzhanova-0007]
MPQSATSQDLDSTLQFPAGTRATDVMQPDSQQWSSAPEFCNIAPHVSNTDLSLDEDAELNDGLYLVGTASEYDAFTLARLAVQGSETLDGSSNTPGLQMRDVSTDPTNPAAFVYYRAKPYSETTQIPMNVLSQLLGDEAIEESLRVFEAIDVRALPIWAREHTAITRQSDQFEPGKECPSSLSCTVFVGGQVQRLGA